MHHRKNCQFSKLSVSPNNREKYQNLNIIYKQDGYFSVEDEQRIVNNLKSSNPKLVLVALGVPKQEEFISKYKDEFNNTIFIGVGGSFDVWSGKVKRAPLLFQRLGLEWLWRLLNMPSRFKRIFPTIPLFLLEAIMEKNVICNRER